MARTYTELDVHNAVLLLTDVEKDTGVLAGLTKLWGVRKAKTYIKSISGTRRILRDIRDGSVIFNALIE